MVEFGPIQMIALGFPEIDKLKGELLKEIFRLSDAKIIRVIGLLAIVKDAKGNIEAAQITGFTGSRGRSSLLRPVSATQNPSRNRFSK